MLKKNADNHAVLPWIAAFFAVFFGFKTLLACILPFAAAYLPARVARKCGERLAEKMKMSRPFSVGAVTFVLLTLVITVFFFLVREGVRELLEAARTFDIDAFSAYLKDLSERLGSIVSRVSPKAYARLTDGGRLDAWLNTAAVRIASLVTEALLGAVGAFPKWFLSLAVTLLSVFYFALDHAKLVAYLERALPCGVCQRMRKTKNACLSGASKILGAYAILLLMTFSELVTGFVLIGVPYAVLLAFVIAVIDILPVLGTGTVLLPWALALLVGGDTGRGIALLVLYAVITVVRQICEPRVVGRSVGLHPLATLAAMYVGGTVGGVAGLLLFPFGAAVTTNVLGQTQRNAKEG